MIEDDTRIFHSMVEFEKMFLPKSFERRLTEKSSDDVHAIGTSLAKDSIDKMRVRITK